MNNKAQNGVVPIFFACDDRFIRYTVVSLFSMIENSSKDRRYRVHILHTNASDEMKAKIFELAADNFEISFNDVTPYLESISDKLPIRHYYTKTTYFRMFIADMFPQYDKAIYIDSDTVVRADIAKLYDTDLGDCYVGACHEQVMEQIEVFGDYCEQVVGVSRYNFFNAGVMLINCKIFREKQLLGKFINYLGVYNFIVTQDEDYLNLICKDHAKLLDQRWNTELAAGLEYDYDADDANIIHFVMANKPWHYENCRGAKFFFEYADRTPVAEDIRNELNSFTDEQRDRDRISGEALVRMAKEEMARPDNFQKMLNKTVRSADRVAIVKKIEQFEREGKFDVDVEDDPPTKPLLPDDIDYFRRSPVEKVKTKMAYVMAKKFMNKITKQGLFIVKEIKGLENMSDLQSGAIITCNHFNAFDSFAMHALYAASGQKSRELYRVIREGNYTSFPGMYGFLMRHFYTLPLSSNVRTMQKFVRATDKLLCDGNFVLFYPEQSMWWNYRKPKPLKPGAYRFSVKNNVPVLPCFITMQDSETMGPDGYYVQEYTIHVGKPIYPDPKLSYKDKIDAIMNENARVWREIYEEAYSMPLVYDTVE